MRIRVVIPALNAAPWIGDAIASLLVQTHPDWTLVVVDDGSTDSTSDVVLAFADRRISLIRQDNAGVSTARNVGIAALAEAGGCDTLLFLDADDWLAPDALSRLGAALDADPQAVAASGRFTFVDVQITQTPPSGDVLRRLLVRNLLANGGHLLLRNAAVQAAGGFVPGIRYGEDWEYWVRIALQGRFAAARGSAPVLFVRRHESGAYRRLAADPAAFVNCTDAIFGNPDLCARFGQGRLAAMRRRAEAENQWIVGRELIRHGLRAEGTASLRHSVRAHPSLKRVVLLATAHILPSLPSRLRGPFHAYPQTDR